jgi:diadenosine tetraphosphate (Ap4A) HIT family hydrolase
MATFTLHPQLAADGLFLVEWPLCQVLRMNDATYPWLILVPRLTDAREILDLSAADRVRLMDEIAWASQALKDLRHPDKINVGALGNVVPQLHVHVLGRFKDDPAWPKPVWGHAGPVRLEARDAPREVESWRAALAAYGA